MCSSNTTQTTDGSILGEMGWSEERPNLAGTTLKNGGIFGKFWRLILRIQKIRKGFTKRPQNGSPAVVKEAWYNPRRFQRGAQLDGVRIGE